MSPVILNCLWFIYLLWQPELVGIILLLMMMVMMTSTPDMTIIHPSKTPVASDAARCRSIVCQTTLLTVMLTLIRSKTVYILHNRSLTRRIMSQFSFLVIQEIMVFKWRCQCSQCYKNIQRCRKSLTFGFWFEV